jgi:HlyD family secretion protein
MKNIKLLTFGLVVIIIISSCTEEKNPNLIEGKVKRESTSIASKVPGRILEIRFHESDIVKAGDTLAVISFPEAEAKLMQAQGAYFSAKSQYEMSLNGATKEQVKQAIAGREAAADQFEFAKKSLDRLKNMYKDSLISAQNFDEAFAKFNGAKDMLDAARAKEDEVMAGVRNEKIKMAEGQMKQAEGAVKETQTAYNERYIIAPKDMMLESITLHEGELALPGYNLFVGSNVNEVYFRVTIPESEISNFNNGTIYKVELPFEKITVDAKLTSVKQLAHYADRTASYPNYEIGESVFELKLVPVSIKDIKNIYNNSTVLLESNINLNKKS